MWEIPDFCYDGTTGTTLVRLVRFFGGRVKLFWYDVGTTSTTGKTLVRPSLDVSTFGKTMVRPYYDYGMTIKTCQTMVGLFRGNRKGRDCVIHLYIKEGSCNMQIRFLLTSQEDGRLQQLPGWPHACNCCRDGD